MIVSDLLDNLATSLIISTRLLEVVNILFQTCRPCNKSDNAIKLVPNLLLQLGTSSANTTCRQLVNRLVTTCLWTCNNFCVFTCVLGFWSKSREHIGPDQRSYAMARNHAHNLFYFLPNLHITSKYGFNCKQ
jgi:hypothetical protein